MVSAYSVASCVGRFTTAFVPERAFKEHGIARTHFLWVIALLAACVSVGNAFYDLDSLPANSLLTGAWGVGGQLLSLAPKHSRRTRALPSTGFLFGFTQGLVPTIVSELFGLVHFASNYAMLNTTLISGSLLMATLLPSAVYERHTAPGEAFCRGPRCFRLAFIANAALCLTAIAAVALLTARTRSVYCKLFECASAGRAAAPAPCALVHRRNPASTRRLNKAERRKRGVKGVDVKKDAAMRLMKWRIKRAVHLLNDACSGVVALAESMHSSHVVRRAERQRRSELGEPEARPGAWAPIDHEIVAREPPSADQLLHEQLQELHAQMTSAFMVLADGAPSRWAEQEVDDDAISIVDSQFLS